MVLSFLLLIFFNSTFFKLSAQESQNSDKSPGFYLECEECDFTFVRQELPFLMFVRDPLLADIHILVTESETGGGGEIFYLNFIGRNSFAGMNFEYEVSSGRDETDDDVRRSLLKVIKAGILPYYSKTGFLKNISIELEEISNRKADDFVIDRWNKWVFSIDAASEFQKEKSQNEFNFSTEGSVEKITEEWKTSLEGEFQSDRENYYDDNELITDRQDSKNLSFDFIKSLSPKWSAGLFAGYSSQTYINTNNRYGLSAGIEYNIFPWEECNRRIFAIRYSAGYRFIEYDEITIYDKLSENLFEESLDIYLELIQPWGEVSVSLEGQHYFHDFSKNRLTLESDISLRITRNIAVFSELESQVVHDQLYLPKGDASVEDILLRRRKLATTYEISGRFGLRFTFGSIYNNIVNERF